ncbi:transposase, partial [Nitrosomonas sp. Nm33]|uniref:transposase n=1 Tax=Nitrosomonas sp. Nm33 TaxID=133724 RepID=UPI00089D6BC9
RPKQSEKRKDAPSSSSLPLMHFKSFYMGSAIHSIVVMDNATFHKRLDTRDAIHNAGHTLEYLPAYSPDLNPIEHKWAQAKALRRQQNQTVDTLFKSYAF